MTRHLCWNLTALLAVYAALWPASAEAPPPQATKRLTLERALALALAHNPELRAAAARVQAAAGQASQARLWPNPELELAAEDWPVDRAGVSDAKRTLGLTQTLPFPGKKKLDARIGQAAVRAAEADLALRRIELVRDVKLAFVQVLAAQERLTVAAHLVQLAQAAARAAQLRVQTGAAADQEQLRAEVALERARIEQAALERELATARHSLAVLLGRPDLEDAPVVGALAESVDLARLHPPPEGGLAAHPALHAARTTQERAELELRRARLEPYPDLRLGVAGGREGGAAGASILEFRVALPLPIFDRSKGRRQQARANAALAEADALALEHRLQLAGATARQRLRTAAEQATAYRERILPKADQALRQVQRGFEQGKFGLTDLLDTQRAAAEARRAYVDTLLELNTAQAELEALFGIPPAPLQPPLHPQSR